MAELEIQTDLDEHADRLLDPDWKHLATDDQPQLVQQTQLYIGGIHFLSGNKGAQVCAQAARTKASTNHYFKV